MFLPIVSIQQYDYNAAWLRYKVITITMEVMHVITTSCVPHQCTNLAILYIHYEQSYEIQYNSHALTAYI